ncbi:DNA repair protein RecN [Clostridium sediminicola]|uniref:DNA repair protein RecN n=1 Tax=Clostridium sediminicola TaxID=3114879 RepID=UPI0031F21C30
MLLQVSVKNFALIENLNVNFEKGLNILTGETGAGKSILIDAISYVLGEKINKNLLKQGENKTFVEAVFEINNPKTCEILRDFNIEFDDIIIVSRETSKSGKSLVKINGKSLLISQMKEISKTLLNIHGQHQNQDLLDSSKHIEYLDKYGEVDLKEVLAKYNEYYEKYSYIKNKIEKIEKNRDEDEKLKDYLSFQLKDIEKANLKKNEDKDLEEQYNMLSNAEKISSVLNEAYEVLNENSDSYYSVYYQIGKLINSLRTIENNLKDIVPSINLLEESFFNIEQVIEEVRKFKENVYYNADELDYINSRIFLIDAMKRKYGESVGEILEFKESLREKIDNIENSDKIINQLHKEKEDILQKLKHSAAILYEKRLIVKKDLEEKIKSELNYVGLEKAVFNIEITHGEDFYHNGSDIIRFLISTNPGQPLHTMESIVSGGELSRIMLCLKTIFADKDDIPTLIFDEIDTGISGRTAQRVAEKMFIISKKHQVFCVTHLPQIASMSDFHLKVFKETVDETTVTNIVNLKINEKEEEIARMIGGSKITKLTIENSKEMIKFANETKKELFSKTIY